MSVGGKGGDSSAAPMLEYGQQALDLQKRVYNDAMTRSKPYSEAGQSALYELMTRLGIGGGEKMFSLPSTAARFGGSAADYANIGGDAQYHNTFGPDQWKQEGDQWYTRQESGTGPTKTVNDWQPVAAVENPIDETRADYGSLLKPFGMDQYQADPGYQFRLSEGEKALERALASRGKFSSMNPEAAKALTSYGQGLASEEYGNAYSRYNADQSNIFNRLAAITGIGQTENQAMTSTGQNYANQSGNLLTSMGNAVVAANQANQANKGSMFNTLLSAAPMIASAGSSLFSGISGLGSSSGSLMSMANPSTDQQWSSFLSSYKY